VNPTSALRFAVDRLVVEIHPTRADLGRVAAAAAAEYLRQCIASRGHARVVFACAPSQDEFLGALVDGRANPVAWDRVTAFQMDEYVGLEGDDPRSFQHYLRDRLLSRLKVAAFHPLSAGTGDGAAVCRRYARLLAELPIDLICMGVGENGHIAFNDPPVAKFDDRASVKKVKLDGACLQQQVNDGCFRSVAEVPRHALTLTVPVFLAARRLSAHVPGPRKAAAVRAMLEGPIHSSCPASVMRLHPSATLHLDSDSAGELSTGARDRAIPSPP
jgi:glucosamine-6-phosphate deaminase